MKFAALAMQLRVPLDRLMFGTHVLVMILTFDPNQSRLRKRKIQLNEYVLKRYFVFFTERIFAVNEQSFLCF